MINKLLLKVSALIVTFLIFFGYFITNQYIILVTIIPITIICGLNLKLYIGKDDVLWIFGIITVIISSIYSYDSIETLKYGFVLSVAIIIKIIYRSSSEWIEYIEKIFFVASSIHVVSTIMYIIVPNLMINICSKILPYQLFKENLRFFYLGSIAGITGQTGMNAFYISLYIAICFSRLSCSKCKKKLTFVELILGLVALLLTAKRGPLLTNILCMIITTIIVSKINIKNIITKFLGIAFIIFMFYFVILQIPQTSIMIEKFTALSNSGDVTNGRSELWHTAIVYFKQAPLLGIGAYATPKVIGEMVHNIYLQLLVELGIIGFIIFLMAMVVSLIITIKKYYIYIKNYCIDRNKSTLILMSIYIQVYFLVYGLSGNPLYGITFLIPYFISVSMNNIYNSDKLKN